MNNDDSYGCGCFLWILFALAGIYIFVEGDEDEFSFVISCIIAIIVFLLIFRFLLKRRKVKKYNERYPGLDITKQDLKRHIKLNRKEKILYVIADIDIDKDFLKIPFKKVERFDWTDSDNAIEKDITIFTSLNNPSLSMIKLSYSSNFYFDEAKKMLYYVITHNEEEETEEIEEKEQEKNNESNDNEEEKSNNSNEELRKIIEEQNKRIAELEKNQKKHDDNEE